MKYKRITFLLILIVIAIIVSGFAFSAQTKQDSKINVTSNQTLGSQDNFTVKLTDSNGKAISNQEIKITFNASNGTQINKTLKTNESGQASLKLENMSAQKYTANVSYAGSDDYNGCNATQNFEIKEKSTGTSSDSKNTNSASGSSSQSTNQGNAKQDSNQQSANVQSSDNQKSENPSSSEKNDKVSINSPLGANPLFA